MIYITQLIYIKYGQEEIFDRFESVAIPIINRYNGKLMLRVRPSPENYIEAGIEKPFEIHLIDLKPGRILKTLNTIKSGKTICILKSNQYAPRF